MIKLLFKYIIIRINDSNIKNKSILYPILRVKIVTE